MRVSLATARRLIPVLPELTLLYLSICVILGKVFDSKATKQPFTAALILVLAVGFASNAD
jgi:uncharacterized protein YqgC (DUF456 family)